MKNFAARYYDFHMVIVDLIANLYKKQRPDLIPLFIEKANSFISTEAREYNVRPINVKEVRSHSISASVVLPFYTFVLYIP